VAMLQLDFHPVQTILVYLVPCNLLVDMLVVLCRAGSVLNSQVAAWVGESNPTSRKLMYRAVKQFLLPSVATQARREITVNIHVGSADSYGQGRQLW